MDESSAAEMIPGHRTIVYIDGYNLYHGLLDLYGRKYSWLDLSRFASLLLSDTRQQLVGVKYFTSQAPGNTASAQRQQSYWKALETCPLLEKHEGRYRSKPMRCSRCGVDEAECRACGEKLMFRNEKRTDVNIATHLVRDACREAFDVAILVGGDTDLVAPVEFVTSLKKRMVVAFPPKRENDEMRRAATGSFVLTEKKFKEAQFPEVVTVAPGATVTRPAKWR